MSAPTTEQVLDVLRTVQDPDLHKDIVTLGFVKDVTIDGGAVRFTVETSPLWALIGSGISVLSLGGLFYVCRTYGRR